jgi:predicted AAA+ superfamily ATPase
MFIGRERELRILSGVFQKRSSNLVTLQGRRRIGKSSFVHHFCKTKKIPLFEFIGLAPRKGIGKKVQLENFAKTLATYLKVDAIRLADWKQALNKLNDLVVNNKSVIFLDEISWMAAGEPDFAGLIKEVWDTNLSKNPNVCLILCGSVSSWIQDNILNSTGFVGRLSCALTLSELSLKDSSQLLRFKNRSITPSQISRCLAITGGVPRYLEEIEISSSVEQAISELFLLPEGPFFTEFDRIFADIFGRSRKSYRDIIIALGERRSTIEELAKRLKVDSSGTLIQQVNNLCEAFFLRRDYTWSLKSSKPSKLSTIAVSDNFLRFFIKYVLGKQTQLRNLALRYNEWDSNLPWQQIFGLQFENTVVNHIAEVLPHLKIDPKDILQIGPYFEKGTKRSRGIQVDCLVQCRFRILHIIECKSGEYLGPEILDEIERKQKHFKGWSVRTHLVYTGRLSREVSESEMIDRRIDFEGLV